MIEHIIVPLIGSLVIAAAPALGQPCAPTLVGLQSGPQHINLGDAPASVYDMEVYDDGTGPSLIAGGIFMIPPQEINTLLNRMEVARFRNGRWTRMDQGLPTSTTNFYIADLTQIDFGQGTRDLFASGTLGNVYRWDPVANTWNAASGGLPLGTTVPTTLLAYQDAQGPVLLAAGSYAAGVMAWRGTGLWQPYAPLTVSSGAIQRLRVIDDGSGPTLVAVGTFRDTTRNINNAARLVNGQWQQYPLPPQTITSITDITTWDDGTNGPETYITGNFCLGNGCAIGRFRNGAWQTVLGGATLSSSSGTNPTFFKIDQGSGTQLYLVGPISVFNQVSYVGRITPGGWQAPVYLSQAPGAASSFGGAACMLRFDDGDGPKTYIGGNFSIFNSVPNSQFGGASTYGLVRGNDGSYESLAQGLGEPAGFVSTNVRYDLASIMYEGAPRLFVGGPFTRAGGSLSNFAAMFDGQQWSPMSMPSFTTPTPVQGATVAMIDGVSRIVGCTVTSPVSPVAYWDGANWVRLQGTGPIGGTPIKLLTFNNELFAFTVSGLQRYSGGGIWQPPVPIGGPASAIVGNLGQGERIYVAANGTTGPGVYEFNGSSYTRVGPVTGSIPQTLTIHDDGSGPTLYVVNLGTSGFIGRLTGNTWAPLGLGLNGQVTSTALASFDDGQGPALYVAGTFTMAGGVTTPGLAKWQNNAWHTFPTYTTGTSNNGRYSMAVFNDRLYIAGEFMNIGPVQADHLAYIQACPHTCNADYNFDGDNGTDADIEAFFRCLAGNCCTRCAPDFNNDGNIGTDADIESFFRVLAGGAC